MLHIPKLHSFLHGINTHTIRWHKVCHYLYEECRHTLLPTRAKRGLAKSEFVTEHSKPRPLKFMLDLHTHRPKEGLENLFENCLPSMEVFSHFASHLLHLQEAGSSLSQNDKSSKLMLRENRTF